MRDGHAIATVQAWQDAASSGEIDHLVELSDPDIELVGPRGGGRGHQLLRDWMARAGLSLTTLRLFARGDIIVVEQSGVWRSAETGEEVDAQTLASSFHVSNGRVTRFARYDNLDDALAEAGLSHADKV